MWVVSGRAITETQVCLYSILICFLLFRDTSHFCVKEKVLSHKGERKLPGITPCYVPAVFLYPCACAHTSEQLYMERHTYYFQVFITLYVLLALFFVPSLRLMRTILQCHFWKLAFDLENKWIQPSFKHPQGRTLVYHRLTRHFNFQNEKLWNIYLN